MVNWPVGSMVGKHIIIKGKIETIKTLEDGRWCETALYCGDEHGKKSSPHLYLVGAGVVVISGGDIMEEYCVIDSVKKKINIVVILTALLLASTRVTSF